MVEQRVAVQDRHSRSSHALALLLALGGAVVLWWTLMTGAAHAAQPTAQAPAQALVETPGPGPVAHLVDHTPVAPLSHEVTHTATQTVHSVKHTVRHTVDATHVTAATTVRTTVSKPVTQTVTHKVTEKVTQKVTQKVTETATAVSAAVHSDHRVRTHRAPSATTRELGATHAAGATSRHAAATTVHAHRAAAPQHTGAATDAGAGHDGPSRPLAAPRADSPAGSSGQPAPTGPGSGAALVDDPPTLQLLASGEHSADTTPALPPEPAYPPGCSPD